MKQNFRVVLRFHIDTKKEDDSFSPVGKVDADYIRAKVSGMLEDIEHPGVNVEIAEVTELWKKKQLNPGPVE